jgi:shikimate dehydrogenase
MPNAPYAEVIGDPVAQSKSPLIHRYWLKQLGLGGDYRARCVPGSKLGGYFADRRADRDWRGCNITVPHKEAAFGLIDHVDETARAIGAVNCVVRRGDGLVGVNTDIDGIAAALDGVVLEGRKAVIIGGGGAARAAIHYLGARLMGEIVILARDPARVEPLRLLAPLAEIQIGSLSVADRLLAASALIINATPLGMAGSPPMPAGLLTAITGQARNVTLFDMVYNPLLTPFLRAGREGGGVTVDGLIMLLGQAKRAFGLFFGSSAPPADDRLREMLFSSLTDVS